MKKVGDIMKEAGFNANSKDSVKEAYIKHLIKAATGVSVATPSEKAEMKENPKTILPLKSNQQLAFEFEESPVNTPAKPKKASTF